MKIAILKERANGEKRVAISPEIVKKLVSSGVEINIEQGAGKASSISDEEYTKAGAKVSKVLLEIIADANVVLKVQPSPESSKKDEFTELNFIKPGALLVGILSPHNNKKLLNTYAEKNVTSVAMELAPRITKAQGMDVLSSQSNLAGYMAVIKASNEYPRAFPMMMTAAGTVSPARVLVMGAGVAGLQAIATAKRLGAIVSAFDVRAAAKEQVESLGAKFIEVPTEEDGSTSGGYAKEMSEEYKQKQKQLIHDAIKKSDIVITTALIPGRPAPQLITLEMVKNMREGSVIIDLAAASGGNCEGCVADKIINHDGVKIIGYSNIASEITAESSKLYSRNLYNFLEYITNKEFKTANIDFNDEIIKACVLTHDGKIVHPNFKEV
ncbi:MAG: Re/Si-specific NAD(P)(+) transhydrogenase subunit alpha [Rickettsiales bacterium]|jgi:NAD(P) transhydrogenase subunit alpha|nr:Re/Si-specific NAD(P)(+) transhydrogenase subunit alpha [Rickettsiales bacterium]